MEVYARAADFVKDCTNFGYGRCTPADTWPCRGLRDREVARRIFEAYAEAHPEARGTKGRKMRVLTD